MNNFIICTFYTPNYSKYLSTWERFVKQWDYEYTAREIASRGTWSMNDCIKPEFIRDMMVDHPDKSVLWVDIDSAVVKKPELFETIDADFAGYPYTVNEAERRFIDTKYRYIKLWNDKLIWGGTLWFANNTTALTLVNLWVENCTNDPHRYVGDQDNLNEVLDKYAEEIGLRFYGLPVTYSYGRSHGKRPDYEGYGRADEAVIIHDFASNEYRKIGNKYERLLK